MGKTFGGELRQRIHINPQKNFVTQATLKTASIDMIHLVHGTRPLRTSMINEKI